MRARIALLLFLALALPGAAQQKKAPKHQKVCPHCECGIAASECHKDCVTALPKGQICEMQCTDECMHQIGREYCPAKKRGKA